MVTDRSLQRVGPCGAGFSILPKGIVAVNHVGLPSGKRLRFAIEHGPIEIVSFPLFLHSVS